MYKSVIYAEDYGKIVKTKLEKLEEKLQYSDELMNKGRCRVRKTMSCKKGASCSAPIAIIIHNKFEKQTVIFARNI